MAEAFAMKLWFKFRENTSLWSSFMLEKYAQNKFPGDCCPKNTDSLVWKRMYKVSEITQFHMFCQLGKGQIHFWKDHGMIGIPSLIDLQNQAIKPVDNSMVCDWQSSVGWNIPMFRENLNFPIGTSIMMEMQVKPSTLDSLFWKPSSDGHFSTKSARLLVRTSHPVNVWFDRFWSPFVSPTISIF